MAILLQLRRGTDINNSLFVGAEGEVSVDLIKKSLRIHVGDGVPGGYELARSNLSNVIIGRTLTPNLNGTHDVGTPSLNFNSLYLKNHIFLNQNQITSIPEGIRITTPTGFFDLTQGIDEGSSPVFNTITIGDTTISELTPFGIRISKGATQLDINQSLTTTSNVSFNSLNVASEINLGLNTSIIEEPFGISIDNGIKVIGLDQSIKTTDDVTFNSVTFGNIKISADAPDGVKFETVTKTYGINQSLRETDQVKFQTVTGDLIGNADTATKLKTPFDVTVSGDVDFSVTGIDGSTNKTSNNATLKSITTAGTFGDASRVPVITLNEKGLVTSVETRPVVAISTDFIIVADSDARDALEIELLKMGMLVLTQDTNFLWQLTELTPDLSAGITTDTKWSQITKSENILLSSSDLTASNILGSSWEHVFGTKGRNSGKYYFEIENTSNEEDRGECGLSNISMTLNLVLEFNDAIERYKKLNGVESATGLPICAEGERIRIAVDFDLGKVWFAIGNTWEFLPGSVDASLIFSPNSELYPFGSMTGTMQKLSVRSNPLSFNYTPPTDFLPWSDDIPVNPPIPTWERFYVSPTRKQIQFTTDPMTPLSYYDFELMLGNCLIVYKLQVSEQCNFEVHESSARTDINPYKFITPTNESAPFVDNGLTYLADGAILRGRRYHIWASMEGGFDGNNKIYGRIYNHTENTYPNGIVVDIWYMPIEKSAIFV